MIIDFSGGWSFQHIQAAKKRGFTRTAGTKDCNLFPFMYVKTDFLQHLKIPKAFADIFTLKITSSAIYAILLSKTPAIWVNIVVRIRYNTATAMYGSK